MEGASKKSVIVGDIMKNTKAIIVLLASISLLLAMVVVNLIVTAVNQDEMVWATTTVKSPYEGIEIKTKEAAEKEYKLVFQYPAVQHKELNDSFERYMKKKEAAFLTEVQKIEAKKLKKEPASLSMSFEIIPAGRDVYSILFTEKVYLTAHHTYAETESFLIDLQEPAVTSTEGLFINSEKASTALQLPEAIQSSVLYIQEHNMIVQSQKTGQESRVPMVKAAPFVQKEWRHRLDFAAAAVKDNSEKKIALTFDDGPNPSSTEAILKTLKNHHAKATFFVLGNRVERYPELVDKIVQEGHEVGNHSWSHPDFTKLSQEKVKNELDHTAAQVEQAAGVSPIAVRPPYGATNDAVNEVIGQKPLLWTIDTLDWKSHDPKAICSIVKKEAKNGSIVLMHDIHQTTAEALDQLITDLEEQGFRFVTVSEL